GGELLGRELVRKDEMRTAKHTAGSDAAESARHLERRDFAGALSNARGDGLPGVPLVMLRFELPLFAGHDAGGFVGNINAGLVADADLVSVVRDGLDAELVGERVVEGVAGVWQRAVNVDHAVVLVA